MMTSFLNYFGMVVQEEVVLLPHSSRVPRFNPEFRALFLCSVQGAFTPHT